MAATLAQTSLAPREVLPVLAADGSRRVVGVLSPLDIFLHEVERAREASEKVRAKHSRQQSFVVRGATLTSEHRCFEQKKTGASAPDSKHFFLEVMNLR